MKIETVTGPISAEELGKTLIHEHFVFGYPGFSGDITLGEYREEEALEVGISVAETVMKHGIKTVVDPTPNECGRNPELLRKISTETGLQIICATGYYYEGEGATPYYKLRQLLGTAETDIYDMFMKEITDGIGRTGIKPGVIKVASSKDQITDYEKMFFKVAAKVQKETGVIIMTHTQEGTMGPEQANLLIENGADPNSIVIGHMCGNTDIAYHLKTLSTGVNIAFDRFGIQGMVGAPFDNERIATLIGLVKSGYADRIMLAHDSVNYWMGRPAVMPEPIEKMMENWHPGHLFENILPKLKQAGVTDAEITQMMEENPRKLFAHSEVVEA
ncbi:phosphotriesterase family protein [Pseudalkalibacillus caeni]|uniref:Phosphotriesterase-related protein n=1 Tax=Exobacillus caeni TaxID=2574798 RepID=A0A5R9F337_9BACL|nr:phosphotriesterase-related protein [Pseudalkalibacillus caeni]TLS36909.1 phosphotriesterase-related protein [Pseudalkalibacillus caeni]